MLKYKHKKTHIVELKPMLFLSNITCNQRKRMNYKDLYVIMLKMSSRELL